MNCHLLIYTVKYISVLRTDAEAGCDLGSKVILQNSKEKKTPLKKKRADGDKKEEDLCFYSVCLGVFDQPSHASDGKEFC